MQRIGRKVFLILPCLIIVIHSRNLWSQTWQEYIGWEALDAELGESLADGFGLMVSHVEAPIETGAYLPDPAHNQFLNPDKNFEDLSDVAPGISGHATTVGRLFYGKTHSIAGGILDIGNYEANDWINFATGFAGNAVPDLQPFAVQNHSWVANTGITDAQATNILARVDYMANVNNMNVVVGTNNGGVTLRLLATGYNSITVGKSNGTHATGLTQFNGAGRVKPEIVAPENFTSFSTPIVSGLAAILRNAGNGTNADNNEAVKAMILAGATKVEYANWSNEDFPLDFVYGAGEANAYNSYKILLAGETDGQSTLPSNSSGPDGWDFGTSNPGQNIFYSIELAEPADQLSVALTWNILIEDINTNPNVFVPASDLADLDMFVVGPDGFAEISNSTTHNIEHIYGRNLSAGTYSIVIIPQIGSPAVDFGLAWRTAEIIDTSTESVSVIQGGKSNGSLLAILGSDNVSYEVQPDPAAGPTETAAVMEFETTCPVNMPNSIQFDLEARVNSANIEQSIELFNYTTGLFVPFDMSPATINDSQFDAYIHAELFNFVNEATGRIRARVSWRSVGPVFLYPWSVRVDRASWSISQ